MARSLAPTPAAAGQSRSLASAPFRAKNCADRLDHDFEIEFEAPSFDVLEIKPHVGLEGRILARRDLPEPSDARLHFQTPPVVEIVLDVVIERMRTWPDQAHISEQDIPQL